MRRTWMWFILGHGVSPAVGWGDVDGQGASGLLDHIQHLHLRLQLQAVAALTLHQGRACPQHPHQPALERAEQLQGPGSSSVLHREVNSSTSSVHIHVGCPCQLRNKHTFKFNLKKNNNKEDLPSSQIHAPCLQPRLDGCGHQPTLQQQNANDRSDIIKHQITKKKKLTRQNTHPFCINNFIEGSFWILQTDVFSWPHGFNQAIPGRRNAQL